MTSKPVVVFPQEDCLPDRQGHPQGAEKEKAEVADVQLRCCPLKLTELQEDREGNVQVRLSQKLKNGVVQQPISKKASNLVAEFVFEAASESQNDQFNQDPSEDQVQRTHVHHKVSAFEITSFKPTVVGLVILSVEI